MELDCGKLVGMLSTDMSKAFDSLYSPLLTKKLESYRFSDKALDLVRSYVAPTFIIGRIESK